MNSNYEISKGQNRKKSVTGWRGQKSVVSVVKVKGKGKGSV